MLPESFWSGIGPGAKLILAVLVLVVVPIMIALIKRLGDLRKTAGVIKARTEDAAADADAAVRVAGKAVELSTPTGNGFAGHVKLQLEEIRTALAEDRAEHRVDTKHLRGEISSIRSELADLRDRTSDNSRRIGVFERRRNAKGEEIKP